MKRIILLMLCLGVGAAYATSWRLNNNPAVNADFTTFQAAHDAASAGDTIYIEGNGDIDQNSYGTLIISKKLVIIGPGYYLTENEFTYANPLVARTGGIKIESTAEGTEIYGLYIFSLGGGNLQDLDIQASNVIISRNRFNFGTNNELRITQNVQNVTISQNIIYGIYISSAAVNILVTNNYIEDRINSINTSNGIFTNNVIRHGFVNVYNSQIKNNILYATGIGDALSVNNAGNYIAYNLVSNNLISGGNYGPGNIGNVDMSTVFVGYPTQGSHSNDGRWQLKDDSPAIGAGEGGIDCGMFGGPLPYVLSGLPAIPRIYEAIVPTAGSTTSGLPVIIKAKSQN